MNIRSFLGKKYRAIITNLYQGLEPAGANKNLLKVEENTEPANAESGISKATDRLELVETATGSYWLPADARGDIIANAIRNNAVFDAPIVELSKKYIKPNSLILDVGSNFGQMTVLWAKYLAKISDNPKAQVHSYEAEPFVYEILQKNISQNQVNVIAHFGAVSNASGQTLNYPVPDFVEHQTYGSYGVDFTGYYNGNGEERFIKTLKIDDQEFELPISFMKCDAQGMDLLVMQGARKTIMKHRMPIIFEYEALFEERHKMCFDDYVNFVKEIGYRFYKVPVSNNYLIVPCEFNELEKR